MSLDTSIPGLGSYGTGGFTAGGYTGEIGEVEVKAKKAGSGSVLDDIFGNFGQIGMGTGAIISALKGNQLPMYAQPGYPGAEQPSGGGPNIWLILGGVALVAIILLMVLKKKGGA